MRSYRYSPLPDINSENVKGLTDSELTSKIRKGKAGQMPAFKRQFTEDQCSSVPKTK